MSVIIPVLTNLANKPLFVVVVPVSHKAAESRENFAATGTSQSIVSAIGLVVHNVLFPMAWGHREL